MQNFSKYISVAKLLGLNLLSLLAHTVVEVSLKDGRQKMQPCFDGKHKMPFI